MFVLTSPKTKAFTAAIAAAAALAVASPGFAAAFESNGHSVEVSYADLNLNNPSDIRVMNQRISRAVSKVCAASAQDEVLACRAKTRSNIKAPVATAIARAETRARYADATPVAVQVGN